MSDYRDPNDAADRTRFRGLISGLACLVIFLALGLAFGVGHRPPTRVASNNVTSSQMTAPPTTATMPTTAPTQAPAPNRP